MKAWVAGAVPERIDDSGAGIAQLDPAARGRELPVPIRRAGAYEIDR